MGKLLYCCAFLGLVALSSATYMADYEDFNQLMKILNKPRILERNKYSNRVLKQGGMVQGLQWKNCGAQSDPMQVKSLTISPDPVKLSGNITVSASVSTAVNIEAPVKVELTLKKKILFWIEIPCVDNIGSCTYDDVCALLKTITCPPQFKKAGIPCQCPINKGSYSLPSTSIAIPAVTLPTWLENGDYQVTAKLSTNGKPIGCFFLQLSLTK